MRICRKAPIGRFTITIIYAIADTAVLSGGNTDFDSNKYGKVTLTVINPFGDVAGGLYYSDAIMWAADKNIVLGYSNDKLGPGDNVTR